MKKHKTLTLAFLLSVLFLAIAFTEVKAQANAKFTEPKKVQADAVVQEEKPYLYVSQMPVFEGGETAFMKFMANNIKHPAKGTAGTTIASFIIEKDGSISNIEIKKSANPAMDQEAVRALKLTSGKWTPGRQNGRIVRVQFTLPVEFTASK